MSWRINLIRANKSLAVPRWDISASCWVSPSHYQTLVSWLRSQSEVLGPSRQITEPFKRLFCLILAVKPAFFRLVSRWDFCFEGLISIQSGRLHERELTQWASTCYLLWQHRVNWRTAGDKTSSDSFILVRCLLQATHKLKPLTRFCSNPFQT